MIHHMLDSLWRRRWAGALAAAVTPPILGADGEPLPGSIAEVSTVRIGGVDQGVLVRRQSTDNPVLLYLAGGPGQLLSLFPLPSLPLSFPPPIPRSTRQPRPAAHLSASPRSHTARSAGQAGGPRAKPGAQQAKQRDQQAKPHDQKARQCNQKAKPHDQKAKPRDQKVKPGALRDCKIECVNGVTPIGQVE